MNTIGQYVLSANRALEEHNFVYAAIGMRCAYDIAKTKGETGEAFIAQQYLADIYHLACLSGLYQLNAVDKAAIEDAVTI